jgi:DNA-directed RNA polymerase I subunit RPA2
MLLKEKLMSWLTSLKMNIVKADQIDETVGETMTNSSGEAVILSAYRKVTPLTKAFEYLIATGNVQSQSGLGLMQASGFSVVAEKISFFRFLAHFRCVHRGAYFTEMRTTTVRKLLPEAWGFICPVHTPDGTPCGLLNHLAASCEIVNQNASIAALNLLLFEFGLVSLEDTKEAAAGDFYPVLLDGRHLGDLPRSSANDLTNELRRLKAQGDARVPKFLEIGYVPASDVASPDPGIYLFASPARMMRPVQNLKTDCVEWIGTFEQVSSLVVLTSLKF